MSFLYRLMIGFVLASCILALYPHPAHSSSIRSLQRSQSAKCKVYKSYQIRGHFTVKGKKADREQRKILTRGLNLASKRCAPRRVSLALVIALIRESGARNLPYGHSSSVGVLQLLNTHGSFAWRMVPDNSIGWFVRGTEKINTSYMKPGQIADAIERPRVRGKYDVYLPEARIIYARFIASAH